MAVVMTLAMVVVIDAGLAVGVVVVVVSVGMVSVIEVVAGDYCGSCPRCCCCCYGRTETQAERFIQGIHRTVLRLHQ